MENGVSGKMPERGKCVERTEAIGRVVLVAHGSGVAAYDAVWRERVLGCVREAFPALSFHLAFLNGEVEAWEAFPEDLGVGVRWVVLPLVLADGVVTRVQLPAALAEYERRRGVRVEAEILPLPGGRPELDGIVRRALEACPSEDRGKCGVLVVQHGSGRRPTRVGDEMARRWRGEYPDFGGFYAGYLSQEPGLVEVVSRMKEECVVVVNWFLMCGNHVMEDIPLLLGLSPCCEELFGWHEVEKDGGGRWRVLYTRPVGECPEFLDAVCGVLRDWLAWSGSVEKD